MCRPIEDVLVGAISASQRKESPPGNAPSQRLLCSFVSDVRCFSRPVPSRVYPSGSIFMSTRTNSTPASISRLSSFG